MDTRVRRTNWSERPLKELPDGVRRRVFSAGEVMVVQYLYDPGAVFPEHSHPEAQIVLVDEGEIDFEVRGERHRLGPGSVLSIPGDVPHGARVVGDDRVRSVNIFHPIKEEFLSEAE